MQYLYIDIIHPGQFAYLQINYLVTVDNINFF
jgi:hypothetical protein